MKGAIEGGVSELGPRLAVPERTRLAELEAVVDRGLRTFVEVGQALIEIRDSRLYRETHVTFEAYLDGRWGMARAHGYRLIDGARVAAALSPTGDMPANEAQARELGPLLRDEGEKAVLEVWRELKAEYGEAITADRIRRLVKRRLGRVEREVKRTARLAAAVPVFDDIDCRLGDFRVALDDLEGEVDAIITDPPYERAWIERDASDFAATAARLLRPAGTLVVMFETRTHYELKPRLDQHLQHRWTGAYLMPGYHGKMWHARVATGWKPILIYSRTDAPKWEYLTDDVFVSDAADKAFHVWGQSVSGTTQLVERFTRPGDLVVDPFLGGGTTAVVCRDLGRRFVGCDVDEQAVATAVARLAEASGLPGAILRGDDGETG